MIWGWLAFLLPPAVISWKEERTANSGTNIVAVFILSASEPHWSNTLSGTKGIIYMEDHLLNNSWSRACKHCLHRIFNHCNVNINARFALTVNPRCAGWSFRTPRFAHSARLSQPVTIMWRIYTFPLAIDASWCSRDPSNANFTITNCTNSRTLIG